MYHAQFPSTLYANSAQLLSEGTGLVTQLGNGNMGEGGGVDDYLLRVEQLKLHLSSLERHFGYWCLICLEHDGRIAEARSNAGIHGTAHSDKAIPRKSPRC